jgi:hypothetical protein
MRQKKYVQDSIPAIPVMIAFTFRQEARFGLEEPVIAIVFSVGLGATSERGI